MLDKLRTEQAGTSSINDHEGQQRSLESDKKGVSESSQAFTAEVVSLKVSHMNFSR